MKYHSNSENLFRKYSNLSDNAKGQDEERDFFKNEVLEYKQRHSPSHEATIPDTSKTSKVIVHIGGMQHMLSATGQDGEAYIHAVAEKADRIVQSIRLHNPGMSMTNILTLALVNAVDQLNYSEKIRWERDVKSEEMHVEFENLKNSYVKQREINWELKKEVLRLNEELRAQQEEEESIMAEEIRLPLEELLLDGDDLEDCNEVP